MQYVFASPNLARMIAAGSEGSPRLGILENEARQSANRAVFLLA